jgi:hypothetical protein
MEESCVARVVSPGRFTSIGDEEAQVNVRRKDKKKNHLTFSGQLLAGHRFVVSI